MPCAGVACCRSSVSQGSRTDHSFLGCGSDGANGQEHGDRLRPIAEVAADHVDRLEAQRRVERDRIRFSVDQNPDAADAGSHFQRELEHGA